MLVHSPLSVEGVRKIVEVGGKSSDLVVNGVMYPTCLIASAVAGNSVCCSTGLQAASVALLQGRFALYIRVGSRAANVTFNCGVCTAVVVAVFIIGLQTMGFR